MEDKIFKVIEDMPRFPGCEEEKDIKKRRQCADKKMLTFLYNEIRYPEEVRKNRTEGMIVVQFVVEKDGSLSNIQAVRKISDALDQEALRVVNLMNEQNIRWIAGKQKGKPVRVQFNLPIRFKLA